MKNAFKTILSLMLVVIVVLGVVTPVAPVASAATVTLPTHQGNSDMWLVDANTQKTASTIYLYGRADYIGLKVYQDKDCRGRDEFCFEMYSDSKYKNCVASYYTGSSSGTKYINIPIAFDDLKSGTYYVKTFVCKYKASDSLLSYGRSPDPDTVRKCKIKITKGGTGMKDMNTVMYGYENTENGPRIYWYSVPGATGYYLYRKSPKTGKYSKIKTVKDSGNKFTSAVDTAMEDKNCTRYYKVVAYKGSAKTPKSLISLKTKILPTPDVKLKVLANNEIRLSWKEIGTRSDYFIYIKGGVYKDWYQIDEVTSGGSSTCIDLSEIQPKGKKLEPNTKYYFTVVADVDGVYTGYKTKGVSTWYLNLPKMKECTYPETGGVTVNWTESVGADKYRIYREDKDSKDFVYIASVDGNTFFYTDESVDNKKANCYLVKAYKDDKLVCYGGSKSAIKLSEPELLSFEADENGTAKLKWNSSQVDECNRFAVYKKNNDAWEYVRHFYYGIQQYSFNLPYAVQDITMTVRAELNTVEGPYNEEGITLQYRPKAKFTDIYAIEGKGAYIDWVLPQGVNTSYLYRKTADTEYELIYTSEDVSSFWDTNVETGVKYTYKVAYSYDNEIVENSAFEKDVEFIAGSEKIRDEVYLPYSNFSNRYAVKCENLSSDINYYLFVKVDGEWQKTSFSHLSYTGNLLLDSGEGITEYAIAIATPDGKVSMISEPSFVIDYNNQNADAVSIAFEETVAIFTWNPEDVDGDEVVIYRNNEILARVPVADGIYRDETAVVNKHYNYKAYINKGGFLSLNGVFASNEIITKPTITVSNTTKGVKLTSTSEDLKNAQFVIGRKAADGSWKTLKKNYNLNSSSYYVDSSAKSGVEYTYRVKVKPYGCDSYGDYEYVTQKYLAAPKISKIKPKSNGLRIYWSKVEGAKKYTIKYFSYNDDQWHTLKTVSSDTKAITDTTIESGECRVYAIIAVNGDYKSAYNEKGYRFLKEPKITSVKKTSKGIRIECNTVEAATGYVFYCREKGSSDWYLIGPSYGVNAKNGKAVYVHENKYLEKGKTYYFKAKAKCASYYSVSETSSKGIKYTG